MNKKWLMLPVGIAAVALFTFLGGSAVKWLWNWLMPMLFGLREVTFWQALGILALCRILFGGIGGRGGGGPRKSRMSLEERQGLRQRMRDRCDWDQAGNPPNEPAGNNP